MSIFPPRILRRICETGLLSSPQTVPYEFSPGKRMRVVSFVRGVVCLGKRVAMRWARAAGASVDVEAEKEGKAVDTLVVWRDSRERGGSRRRRGREELIDTPWRAVRREELDEDRGKLLVGPDAGVVKDGAAKLLDGVRRSLSLVSDSRESSPSSSWGV
jgi:hypothetical protein